MGNTHAPIIGVTVDISQGSDSDAQSPFPEGEKVLWLKQRYVNAIEASGGAAILLPPAEKPAAIEGYLDLIDGLVITGGEFDIDPALYGEKKIQQCGELKPDRTKMEFLLYRAVRKRNIPVLGVCGGMQVINVAHGGTLYQDIGVQKPGAIRHEQKPIPSAKASHTVTVAKNSLLSRITKKAVLKVNSTHHQAIKDIGKGFAASGVCPDGIVEAIEPDKKGGVFLLGVQWHPELLTPHDEPSLLIYKKFVAAAKKYQAQRS